MSNKKFFVLMPGNWPEADKYLSRPLLGSQKNPSIPWISVAQGIVDGKYDFVERASLDRSQKENYILEANTHAANETKTWTISEQAGFIFKKPSLLRAIISLQSIKTIDVMDDLSTEQILNNEFLKEASRLCKSPDLILIVPKRGWLLAAPGKPGDFPKMMKMNSIASGVFGRAENQAISNSCFFWNESLIGYNSFDGASGSLSLIKPEKELWFVE
ncbi:hypothetical protein [Candidatus Uabimicrobium sp. HlEnr_7]|uniref:hypothetical protein n=1 Tax=Candidatus Uabimicrobium helgolandensis TaxID=3095367 RepID=UPI0035562E70